MSYFRDSQEPWVCFAKCVNSGNGALTFAPTNLWQHLEFVVVHGNQQHMRRLGSQ